MIPPGKPIVQISLDVTTMEEALDMAHKAVRAGVQWLEAGTPLILSQGLGAVRALREAFPHTTIVADTKIMDGGYLEAEMAALAGADYVVVMGRAHEATIRQVVRAGRTYGIGVMVDDLATEDKPQACKRFEELGADIIIHHVGYDERRDPGVIAQHGGTPPRPSDDIDEILAAVSVPVQAVGGLSVEEAIELVRRGLRFLVLGAPLVIDSSSFRSAPGDVEGVLREIMAKLESIQEANES
ncbi:Orotidine 5'-phosphate decarboxylase [Thermobaculum terrenum ATCC BAA-798]|uniref:Orotidine 5'-phosphate decarboxylase n=1 Tax=Thermobaculum terrenum (strain ATCC BAA-798 / CCMEE 7001 / YNP1) TaxID=525904 RepID=D1CHF1_THET1|nr:orotidine 5'-phosphate decarboxylase / HUMPS family protein [Thermobaculum terrenum]ACZ43172.1 Orotidine 5'-phosphate decarboxylase [Thermobaculum terrenum ATCC BAA-798]